MRGYESLRVSTADIDLMVDAELPRRSKSGRPSAMLPRWLCEELPYKLDPGATDAIDDLLHAFSSRALLNRQATSLSKSTYLGGGSGGGGDGPRALGIDIGLDDREGENPER